MRANSPQACCRGSVRCNSQRGAAAMRGAVPIAPAALQQQPIAASQLHKQRRAGTGRRSVVTAAAAIQVRAPARLFLSPCTLPGRNSVPYQQPVCMRCLLHGIGGCTEAWFCTVHVAYVQP